MSSPPCVPSSCHLLATLRDGEGVHKRAAIVAQDSRSTRKNTILEFIESEQHYLRDLVEVKEVGNLKKPLFYLKLESVSRAEIIPTFRLARNDEKSSTKYL